MMQLLLTFDVRHIILRLVSDLKKTFRPFYDFTVGVLFYLGLILCINIW